MKALILAACGIAGLACQTQGSLIDLGTRQMSALTDPGAEAAWIMADQHLQAAPEFLGKWEFWPDSGPTMAIGQVPVTGDLTAITPLSYGQYSTVGIRWDVDVEVSYLLVAEVNDGADPKWYHLYGIPSDQAFKGGSDVTSDGQTMIGHVSYFVGPPSVPEATATWMLLAAGLTGLTFVRRFVSEASGSN